MAATTQPPLGFVPYRVAWGAAIYADGRKAIGRSLRTIGLYDLAVTETLCRLVQPGNHAVDAGANVGYMTVLMARLVGPAGRVTAFEPHPELFTVLQRNIQAHGISAQVDARPVAVGAKPGYADLVIPGDFGENDGIAFIGRTAGSSDRKVRVGVACLDEFVESGVLEVLKMDVEGYEGQVLEGGRKMFAEGRVRHVVFEDHMGASSPVVSRLRGWGYTVYSIGWSLMRLRVIPVGNGSAASRYEAPSFIATRDPAQCMTALGERGWRSLRVLPHLREPQAIGRGA